MVMKYSTRSAVESCGNRADRGAISRKANSTCTPVCTTRTSCISSTRLRSQRCSGVSLRPSSSGSTVCSAMETGVAVTGPAQTPEGGNQPPLPGTHDGVAAHVRGHEGRVAELEPRPGPRTVELLLVGLRRGVLAGHPLDDGAVPELDADHQTGEPCGLARRADHDAELRHLLVPPCLHGPNVPRHAAREPRAVAISPRRES